MLGVEALQHLADVLFLVGRVVRSAVLLAVHIGCGSGETLSCWVRMVAEARDENMDTRQGCSTASVPPLKSNQNVGKATWFSGSSVRPFPGACPLVLAVWVALASGLLFRFCVWVWSRRVFLALFCCLVSSSGSVSKRGNDPGHRPKDRFFSDRPTTCRAGSPWWPGVRGDGPRTDLLAGTPFLRTSLQWYWWCLLGTYFGLYRGLVFLRLLLFRSSVQTHRRGLVEEPPRVERALSVEVVRPFLVVLTLLVTGCAVGLQ